MELKVMNTLEQRIAEALSDNEITSYGNLTSPDTPNYRENRAKTRKVRSAVRPFRKVARLLEQRKIAVIGRVTGIPS